MTIVDADLIAKVEDVQTRIGRDISDPDEVRRVAALLADASSMVRSIAGRPFGTVTVVRRLPVREGLVRFGGGDVTAVTAVHTVSGVAMSVTWDGRGLLNVGNLNQFDVDNADVDAVDVTYVRSGQPAPQWVVAIVAQMAARAFGRPADQSGVSQESIAGYSYSVGSAAAAGGVGLLSYEERRLREAFPPSLGSMRLRVGP